MAFDPDKFLSGPQPNESGNSFDPDAFLSDNSESKPFDPDAFLSSPRVDPPGPVPPGADVSSLPSARGASSSLPLEPSTHPADIAFQEKVKADAMAKAQKESGLAAAGREAAFAAAPTIASIGTGAAVGAGLAAIPSVAAGPLAPLVIGGGGIVGGIAGMLGAEWAQGKAIEKLAPEKAAQWQAERAAASQVHPWWSFLGGAVPQVAAMRPSVKNVASAAKGAKMLLSGNLTEEVAASPMGRQLVNQMFNVGLGAGVQGAQEAYAQYQAGDFNGARLMAQTLAGALINEPTKFGVKLGLHPSDYSQSEVQKAPRPKPPMADEPTATQVRQFTPENRAIYEDDVSRFSEARAREGKAPVKLADLWTPEVEAADKMADNLGIRMVVVDGAVDHNGASLTDDPSVIFVSAQSEQPIFTVAAHEVKHVIDTAHPDVAAKLDAVLAEHIAERGPKPGETHADAFAEALSNPQFWQRLARKDQTLFQRVYETVMNIIAKVNEAIPEAYRVKLKSAESFEAVQKAAVDAYHEVYGRVRQSSEAAPNGNVKFWLDQQQRAKNRDEWLAGARQPAIQPAEEVQKPVAATEPISASRQTDAANKSPAGREAVSVREPERAEVNLPIHNAGDTSLSEKAAKPAKRRAASTASDRIADKVLEYGGLRHYTVDPGTGRRPQFEENQKLIRFMRQKGMPLDKMLAQLKGDQEIGGMVADWSEDDLRVYLTQRRKRTSTTAERPMDSAQDYLDYQTSPDAPYETVNAMDIDDGALVWTKGEWHKSSEQADGGKLLKDGATIKLDDFDNIAAKLVVSKKDPAYKTALKQYKAQEARKAGTESQAEPLSLEQQTPEDVELANRKAAAKRAREKMEAERTKPLVAKELDTTGDMFDADKADNPLFAAKPKAQPAAAPLAPTEAVSQGRAIKVPTGTLKVRATYDNGKQATVYVRDLDTLAGSGKITKLEPLQGGDKPVKGEITVKPDGGKGGVKYSERKHSLANASPEARSAEAKMDAERAAERAMFKKEHSFQQLRDWFGSRFVSWEAPIETRLRNAGEKAAAVMRSFRAVRGASGRANERVESVMRKALVDNGLKTKEDMDFLNKVREAQRTIEVDEVHRKNLDKQTPIRNDKNWTPEDEANYQKELNGFKSPATTQEAKAYLQDAKNDPRWQSIEKANVAIQAEFTKNLDALKEAGIISEALHQYLTENHKFYQPRVFLDKIDPVRIMDNGRGGKVEVHDSGIRALKMGSDKAMLGDTTYLLANNIYHTESVIAKNKATQDLAALLKAKPDVIDAKFIGKDEAIPAGYEAVNYRENGVTKTIAMKRELAQHWRLSDPAIDQEAAKLLRLASGTSLVKFLATAGNPEFAVANVIRDIGLIWLGGKQFSPFLPVALGQTARNLGNQALSRNLRRILKAKYSEFGGSTDYLSTAGHLTDLHNPGAYTTGRRMVNKVAHAMGYIGTLAEEANRLSHMQQALRKMGVAVGEHGWEAKVTPEQWSKAVYEASNLLDFRQGGQLTKMLDNVLPFVNASTQGTRAIVRAFKERPMETTAKAAQLVAIGAYIAALNRKNNQNAWDSMSESDKNTRLNIALPASRQDRNGNERHAYFSLPIDQAWRPFMVLGEMIAERDAGKEVNPARLAKVVNSNFTPVDLTTLPPVANALLTYTQNHDFWRGEDVWKGRKVEPSAERLQSTGEGFKKIGDATGLSPARLQASMKTLVPQNPWSTAAGLATDIFGAQKNEQVFNRNLVDIERVPFIRKLLRFTPGRQITREDITKAKKLGVPVSGRSAAAILNESAVKERAANTIKQMNDSKFDALVASVKAKQSSRADVMRAIYKIKDAKGRPDMAEMKRIRNRLHQRYPELHFPSGGNE